MSTSFEDSADFPLEPVVSKAYFNQSFKRTRLKIGSLTHTGYKRQQNQDHYAVIQRKRSQEVLQSDLPSEDFEPVEDVVYLMIVADGIGGSDFGELASRLVIQKIWELGTLSASWVMRLTEAELRQYKARVQAYANSLQTHLMEESGQSPAKLDMGTTVTAAYAIGRDVILSHVGDSRAYLLRENELLQITEDQTMAKKLIKMGYNEERVAELHRILANYFGTGMTNAPEVAMHHVELQDDDRLMLCTDGLFKELSHIELRDHLAAGKPPQETCEALLEVALERGGRDNITIILADIDNRHV